MSEGEGTIRYHFEMYARMAIYEKVSHDYNTAIVSPNKVKRFIAKNHLIC